MHPVGILWLEPLISHCEDHEVKMLQVLFACCPQVLFWVSQGSLREWRKLFFFNSFL